MYSAALGWNDVWIAEHKEEIVGNPECFFCHGKTYQITDTLLTYIGHCSKHLLVSNCSFKKISIRILGQGVSLYKNHCCTIDR